MRKRIFYCCLFFCLFSGFGSICAQNETVSRKWGRVFGSAQTDRDFLIYDATCSQGENPAIYIVGKAEAGTGFELKQGENTYFHVKDEYTDAFLACISLDGELMWSTYLPALENGYYNAFATTIQSYSDSSIIVLGNSYCIQNNDLQQTKELIPACEGKLFYFECSLDGRLLRSKSSILNYSSNNLSKTYPPRLFKGLYALDDVRTLYLSGISYVDAVRYNPNEGAPKYYVYSGACNVEVSWQDKIAYDIVLHTSSAYLFPLYCAHYFLSLKLDIDFAGVFNAAYMSLDTRTEKKFWHYPKTTGLLFRKDNSYSAVDNDIYARGVDLFGIPPLRESWNCILDETEDSIQYYAKPVATLNNSDQAIFHGTVQNIHAYNGKYLVQGIHCRDYDNGFFKKDGTSYTYSHNTDHPIPRTEHNFYQERNNNLTAVPYLLLYDSATLFGTIAVNGKEDNGINDFQTPIWGSYLNTDWFYEDFFHVTDSGHRKDIYQPYEPILCSHGDKFFIIGNTKSIGTDLVDNMPMTEETYHHQGVILAFQLGCPPERTAFENVPFLCPDDSVELQMPAEYTGFKFRFDPDVADNAAIILNADSSRAWAKQPGIYQAELDGSSVGCPNAQTDSVQIKFSPYPEPVSALPSDTITSCAAFKPVLQAVAQPDTSFSYLWYNGDTSYSTYAGFAGDSLLAASVTVNGYCTGFSDTAIIRFMPPYVNLGNDTVLCSSVQPNDTAILLHLDANQDYFPAADWIFRWKINTREAGRGDSLLLRFSDFDSVRTGCRQALVSVFVSLSDTETEGCTASDSLLITFFSLPDGQDNVFLPQDSILCAHLDLDLQLPDMAEDYHAFWLDQDGITLPFGNDTNRFSIQGLRGTDGFGANTDSRQPRFLQLRLDHKICGVSFFDTLRVFDQVRPSFTLPFHDTVICLDEPVELDSIKPFVYKPFYGFEWNDGRAGSAYSFTDSGSYILRFFVREGFGVCGYDEAYDTVHLKWSDPAQTLISIPEDTAFCEKLSITLDASVPFPSTRYSWQEGNLDELIPPSEDSTLFTSPFLRVDREASYGLFLLDTLGCLNKRQISIHEEDCKPKIGIPNVFTPNGDGVNDVWKFTQLEKCYRVDILVVDRKGSHVLHEKLNNVEDFSWNGCYRNGSKKLPDGAYFYMVTYKDAYGKNKVQSGSVTILGTSE